MKNQRLVLTVVAFAVLLIANGVVAFHHLGTRAGQTYRWINRANGQVLTYTPSHFGAARIEPGSAEFASGTGWQLVEPDLRWRLLPWNWLAAFLEPPAPHPDMIAAQAVRR